MRCTSAYEREHERRWSRSLDEDAQPGDEQGPWSRAKLIKMDSRFRAAMEKAMAQEAPQTIWLQKCFK
jgi:hypothetical protein